MGGWGGGEFKELLGIQRFKELEGAVLTENAQEKGVSRRGGSQAERQTKEDYESMNSKTQQEYKWEK